MQSLSEREALEGAAGRWGIQHDHGSSGDASLTLRRLEASQSSIMAAAFSIVPCTALTRPPDLPL